MPRSETDDSVGLEPVLPEGDRPRTAARFRGDAPIAVAAGQQQDDPRSTRRIGTPAARPLSGFQFRALLSRQHKWSRWHAPSYALQVVSTRH